MPAGAAYFRVDVVVAVRDEEATIPSFLAELDALVLPDGCDLGVIFVEDSSRDTTRELLERVASQRPEVGYYALARGFGQGPAIVFGASRSAADAVIMMDVDGGHPTQAIPEMIGSWRAGARVVQCVRRRLEGRDALRRIGTAGFRLVLRALVGTDFEMHSIYYRLASREVLDAWLTMPRYWRYLRFPLLRGPGELVALEVDAAERTAGQSKYSLARLIGLGANGVASLTTPARIGWGAAGLAGASIAATVAGVWPLAVPLVGAAVGLVAWSRSLDRFALMDRVEVLASRPREPRAR